MKKIITGMVTAALCLSVATTAFAAEITPGSIVGSTTLTTEKAPTYVVVIPEKAEIAFDVESNPIGDIEYQSGNLEPGAYVTVTLSEQTDLANVEDSQYTIPYRISCEGEEFDAVVYLEETAAGTKTPLTADITKAAWEDAKAGAYEATLIFTISYTNE